MHDDLDKLIDEGLAAYGRVEPLAGLEERVLGRVRAVRRRRWTWIAAIPAVAAAAWVAVMVRPPAPVPPPVVALTAPPAPAISAVPVEQPKPRTVVKARWKAPDLPKRPLFPTPTRLSVEERMLVALAASHPEQMFLPPPPEKLEIKPIEIAPLDAGGAQ